MSDDDYCRETYMSGDEWWQEMIEIAKLRKQIDTALEFAVRFGGIDGAHHKMWVIDQMVRALAGDGYDELVKEACNGDDGPETYEWDVGIAPVIIDLSVGRTEEVIEPIQGEGQVLPLMTAHHGFAWLTAPTEPYDFSAHSPEETNQLAKDMVASLYHYNGLGISANQLGLPYSVFAMRGAPHDFVCFNPVIAMLGDELVDLEEACLSFKHLVFKIKRAKHLRVRFAGPNGEVVSQTFTGITARVFLHEMDHLEGRMWFSSISKLQMKLAIKKAKKLGTNYEGMGLYKFCYVKEEK